MNHHVEPNKRFSVLYCDELVSCVESTVGCQSVHRGKFASFLCLEAFASL